MAPWAGNDSEVNIRRAAKAVIVREGRLLSGEVGSGAVPDLHQTGVEWLPLERIEEYELYPRALRPHLRVLGREPSRVYIGDVN
jgi:hypothetical protein